MYTYALLLAATQTGASPAGPIIGVIIAAVVLIVILATVPNAVKVAREKKSVNDLNSSFELYTVAEGDTLWSISEKFFGDGAKLNELKTLNDMKMDGVVPGQILKIRKL